MNFFLMKIVIFIHSPKFCTEQKFSQSFYIEFEKLTSASKQEKSKTRIQIYFLNVKSMISQSEVSIFGI